MDLRLTVFFCLMAILLVSAVPSERDSFRERRDVMDSMKNAWSEMVKTLGDAGDAVVHVFKPTESTLQKIESNLKSLTQ